VGKTYFQDWGLTDYQLAWDKQEVLFNKLLDRKKDKAQDSNGEISHFLIFVEHPHVYTLGKSGSQNNLLINAIQLQAKHASFVNTNRGGDITYHGPGQIVGYPILDLDDLGLGLKQYIHKLEESIIQSLAEFGLHGTRLDGATGVWLDVDTKNARKICAIGVKSSRYVTMHGFALNVNTGLEYFNYINPCGFIDKGVTSIQKELGKPIDFNEAKTVVKRNIEKVFGFNLINSNG
jgi:lipoyl(octanoyl) transferase